jgi:hypothetical protein
MVPEEFHGRIAPQVARDIEARGIHIAQPDGLRDVYYLARVDTLEQVVQVGYFLVWPGEFPDFGRRYQVSRKDKRRQLALPLYYTNWLYLPRSGGLQRLMFGRGDVEGIAVIYSLSNGMLGIPLAVSFEMPGHRALTIPDSAGNWSLRQVTEREAPSLQIASWNHMFKPPGEDVSMQAFPVRPFPMGEWERLNMNRRRAEIAKRDLGESASQP